MNIPRICALLVLLAWLFPHSLFAQTASDSNAEQAKQCSKITIAAHGAYPPIQWVSHGHVEGAGIVIAKSILQNLQLNWQTRSFSSLKALLKALEQNSQIDLAVGLFHNSKREHYLEYIQPAFSSDELAVFTLKDQKLSFHHWQDLRGQKGLTTIETTTGNSKLDTILYHELKAQPVRRLSVALHKLTNHEADYLIAPRFNGQIAVRKAFKGQIQAQAIPFSSAKLYFAFNKASACAHLATEFGKQLTQLLQSDQIKPLIQRAYATYLYQDRLGMIHKDYDEREK